MSKRNGRSVKNVQQEKKKAAKEMLMAGLMDEGKSHGTSGRTSVADLILARTRLLQGQKPTIQVAKPPEIKPAPVIVPEPVVEPVIVTDAEKSIIASNHHKELIWKEARENRDYYIEQQLMDDEKLPWFRYVKKESQYSEFIMLDKSMALELLKSIWQENDGNRKLKEWLKETYKRDILTDRWIPSDEAIGIDYNGCVYNGRHRLTALLESEKEWPFYMTFNCLEEAKFTVDSGAKRSSTEKLRLVISANMGNRTTGFCKAIMRGLNGKLRFTETEIAEFAIKWENLIVWISEHVPTQRAEVQAAIAKAYLWYGPGKIVPFCERLCKLTFSEDGDPARALYLALQRQKMTRINVTSVAYKKTLNSISAEMNNKPMSRLYEKDEDIFVWLPNWELPEESWYAKNCS